MSHDILYCPGLDNKYKSRGYVDNAAKDIVQLKHENEILRRELDRKNVKNESLTKEVQTLRTSSQSFEVC
jgi:hypothetical protein